MALHLSRSADCQRQSPGDSGRSTAAFQDYVCIRLQHVLRAAPWQHDLRHERHGQSAQSPGGQAGDLSWNIRHVQRRRILRYELRYRCRTCGAVCQLVWRRKRRGARPCRRGPAPQTKPRRRAVHISRRRHLAVQCDRIAETAAWRGSDNRAGRACRAARHAARGALMLGKLGWNAIPFDQPIPLVSGAVVILIVLGILIWVIAKGWGPYLWKEWITSVDHKHIGIMYVLLGLIMLLRGFIDALMMRSQQTLAYHAPGYLPPEHYNQVFSTHGTIMVLFAAMPLVIGLMNFIVPLQLGSRDVAFPTLNSVSFWLTATGALLVNLSLIVGEFARTGWLPYPPLSELRYSPGVGVDYYLWAVQISGVGTLLTGINFVTTILK